MIVSAMFMPLPPKNSVSSMTLPVMRRNAIPMSIKIRPPSTEVGMSDLRKNLSVFLSALPTIRLIRSTAARLTVPQTPLSQKFCIIQSLPCCDVMTPQNYLTGSYPVKTIRSEEDPVVFKKRRRLVLFREDRLLTVL